MAVGALADPAPLIHSWEAERDDVGGQFTLSLFIQSRTSVSGTVLPTLKVGLLISGNIT